MRNPIVQTLFQKSWIWAVLGTIFLWIMLGVASNDLSMESFYANAYTASYLGLVALGQMLVITSGRGAIDLSIPGVITLAAYVSMGVVNGSNAQLVVGVAAVIVLGVLIGLVNGALVIFVRIPPIIATMAVGYILITLTSLYNRGFAVFNISPILLGLTRNRIFGIPVMIFLVIAVAAIIHFIVRRTTYGRALLAVGQNVEAARLAGVNVVRVEIIAYMISGVLAGIGGLLIAARVGGAFLGMGDSYMLESVGSVVIGGTLISGGKADTIGTLAGCLFLGFIITTMQVAGFDIGIQNIVKGLLIITVLVVSTHKFRA